MEIFKVSAKKNLSSKNSSQCNSTSGERSVLDLSRSGLSIWTNEQGKTRNLNFSFPREGLSWESHDDVADWFVESMTEGRLISSAVEILLPRSAVCLHLLELPSTDELQLEGMVQIQVESLYGDRADSIAFDYSPLDWSTKSGSSRFVLLATTPKKLLESLQQLCKDASLNLKRVLIRDLVLDYAMPHDEHINFFVWMDDSSRMIGVALGNQVIQSISIPTNAPLPSAEVFRGYERRLLQSLPGEYRELDIGKRLLSISVSEPMEQHRISNWAKSIGLPDQRVLSTGEAYSLAQSKSLQSKRELQHTIDFQNPYHAKPAKSFRGPIIAAASIVLIGLGSLFAYRNAARANGEAILSGLQQQVEDLQAELDALAEPVKQHGLAQSWQANRVNWGNELVLISKQSSAAKNAYLYRLQMDSFDADRLPVVRMDGRATSVPDAMNWNRQLSKLNHRYSIQPQSLDSAITDPDYPTQFRVEAQLNRKKLEDEELNPSTAVEGTLVDSEFKVIQVEASEGLAQ